MARHYNSPGADYDVSDASIVASIGTGDFTWCVWVRTETTANGPSGLVANGLRAPAIYVDAGIGTNPAKWGFYWGGMNEFDSTVPTSLSGGGPQWSHLCVVRSGTTITGYFNGVVEATTFTISSSWTDSQMTVGAASTAGFQGLQNQGHVAEQALWNRALSAAEIKGLGTGLTPDWYPRAMVLYTPLYHGGTDTVKDYVANGAWTETGTVSTQPGPRLSRPLPRFGYAITEAITIIAATAGGTFPTSLQPHINTLENSSPFVWLFEVEVPTDPPTRFRFCNQTEKIAFGVNSDGDPIQYDPLHIEIGEWSQAKSGDLPELSVVVSNIRRDVGTVLEAYSGLHGAPVVVRIVNRSTLLDVNAQVRFDGTVRAVTVNNNSATFAIANYNLYQEAVPAHRFLKNHCPFLFGGVRCNYIIPTSPTGVVGGGFSTCAKHLDACTVRGEDEVARGLTEQHPARFGAFRGIARLSSKVPLQ